MLLSPVEHICIRATPYLAEFESQNWMREGAGDTCLSLRRMLRNEGWKSYVWEPDKVSASGPECAPLPAPRFRAEWPGLLHPAPW